ncbi:MAG: adenosylcobinamide-phosphate synthase CbiB [Gemmatimonadaceae bacterium]
MNTSAINALLVDLVAGEPPNRAHPTVWMGKLIAGGRSRRQSRRDFASLAEGALILGAGITLSAIVAPMFDRARSWVSPQFRTTFTGLALKPALSLRPLIMAARKVQFALEDGDLTAARKLLSCHLVSRDTNDLSEAEVAGAAIASVAENLSDSVVAPLLAFRAGGLTAAYAYRFINTADAMLGYRTSELEWFGKSAARVDDIANIIPARLTAVLICATARAANGSTRHAIRIARRDAHLTESPNAGWPMAAMAGALDVALTKRGQYALNDSGYSATPSDIARCCRIALTVSALAATLVDVL